MKEPTMPSCTGHHEIRKWGFHKGHYPFGGGLGPVVSPVERGVPRRGECKTRRYKSPKSGGQGG